MTIRAWQRAPNTCRADRGTCRFSDSLFAAMWLCHTPSSISHTRALLWCVWEVSEDERDVAGCPNCCSFRRMTAVSTVPSLRLAGGCPAHGRTTLSGIPLASSTPTSASCVPRSCEYSSWQQQRGKAHTAKLQLLPVWLHLGKSRIPAAPQELLLQ